MNLGVWVPFLGGGMSSIRKHFSDLEIPLQDTRCSYGKWFFSIFTELLFWRSNLTSKVTSFCSFFVLHNITWCGCKHHLNGATLFVHCEWLFILSITISFFFTLGLILSIFMGNLRHYIFVIYPWRAKYYSLINIVNKDFYCIFCYWIYIHFFKLKRVCFIFQINNYIIILNN